MVPELDGVLVASPSWQQLTASADTGAEAAGERELLDRIAAGGYDVMLVFTSFSQSPWPAAHLGLLAGVGTRVVHSREFAGAVATHWVTPPPDTTHHVDRSLHLLAAIGVPDRGRSPALRVPEAAARGGRAALAPEPRFALLVPGASCPSRRYPADRFGTAAAMIADAGLPVLVAGTAAEAGLVDDVVRGAGSPGVRALPAAGLPVFTALVARAAVALTNNSGGLHLADAVGTPVVVTYAGTERLGDVAPRSVPSVLLQVPVPCSPCRQLACPFHLRVPRRRPRAPGPGRAAARGAGLRALDREPRPGRPRVRPRPVPGGPMAARTGTPDRVSSPASDIRPDTLAPLVVTPVPAAWRAASPTAPPASS